MSIRSPEFDRRLSGGRTEWDVRAAGNILALDYFDAQVYTLVAEATNFAVAGPNTNLRAARVLLSNATAISWTSFNTVLSKSSSGRTLLADSTAFAVSGPSTNLRAQRRLLASLQSSNVGGLNAGLRASRMLIGSTAGLNIAAVNAGTRAQRRLVAVSTAYNATGASASVSRMRAIAALGAAVQLAEGSAQIIVARVLPVSASSITVDWREATITRAGVRVQAGALVNGRQQYQVERSAQTQVTRMSVAQASGRAAQPAARRGTTQNRSR